MIHTVRLSQNIRKTVQDSGYLDFMGHSSCQSTHWNNKSLYLRDVSHPFWQQGLDICDPIRPVKRPYPIAKTLEVSFYSRGANVIFYYQIRFRAY